jgi:hypothetical protein
VIPTLLLERPPLPYACVAPPPRELARHEMLSLLCQVAEVLAEVAPHSAILARVRRCIDSFDVNLTEADIVAAGWRP